MGTRHLIKIKKDGEIKVSQYGQWDGYPDGQGLDILRFLINKAKVEKLKKSLDKVRFLDIEGKDKKIVEDFDSKKEEDRTEGERIWFEDFISRDVGSKILDNIINFKGEEILLSKDDGDWCEGFFTIDLDKMIYKIKYHSQNATFDINNLPDEDDFLNKFKEDEDE